MLTPEIRSFLKEPRFAVLGTLKADGRIQQTVMWYDLRGDTIIMNTTVGRHKEKNIHRDPRISLCIEDDYRYVTIEGAVTETIIDQEVARADIFGLARRYNPGATDAEIDERFSNFRQETRTTIVVRIDSVHANGI